MIINLVTGNMRRAESKIKKKKTENYRHKKKEILFCPVTKYAYYNLISLNIRMRSHQFAVRKPEV
jgi:hypothetical protein